MKEFSTPVTSKSSSNRQRLQQWDLRLMIAIPALMVLLVIAVSLTHYLFITNLSLVHGQGPEEAEAYSILQSRVLVSLLLFAAIALISGAALAWSILKPIHGLADAFEEIARGSLKEPLKIKGGFEIDRLGESFNSVIHVLHTTIEERDAFLNEGLTVGSLILDTRGKILSANRRAFEILRVEPEDAVGQTLEDALASSPHDSHGLIDLLRERLREAAHSKLGNGREDRMEGEHPLAITSSPVFSPGGTTHAVAFHFRDLSRVRDLNLLFTRTDQMAALGTFTMGLSHELRNPMAAIKGSAQLLKEKAGEDATCQPYIVHIVREVDRLERLVRELYNFSRFPGGPRMPCDLNDLARNALQRVLQGQEQDGRKDIRIVEHYEAELPRILAQQDRMMQAIGNVLINALDHAPPKSTISIRTSHQAAGPEMAILEVSNTGSRIAPENLEKIFEPFYSTKTGGMGLGLAIAYQIAVQNRCLLKAFSDPDQARFQFVFRASALER